MYDENSILSAMSRTTSPGSRFEPRVSFLLIAFVSGCRVVAGYDDTAYARGPDAATYDAEAGRGGGDGSAIQDAKADHLTDAIADADVDIADEQTPIGDEADPDVAPPGDANVLADAGDDGVPEDVGASTDSAAADVTGDGPRTGCTFEPPDGGPNLVSNPDFEAATDSGSGWSAPYGPSFSVSSTYAHCGGRSGAVTNRTSFFNCAAYALQLPEGTAYKYSAWVMQDGDTDISMAVQWFSASSSCPNGGFGSIGFVTVRPNSWTRLSGSQTVATNCATQYIYIVQQDPKQGLPADASVKYPNLYLDDVYLALQ